MSSEGLLDKRAARGPLKANRILAEKIEGTINSLKSSGEEDMDKSNYAVQSPKSVFLPSSDECDSPVCEPAQMLSKLAQQKEVPSPKNDGKNLLSLNECQLMDKISEEHSQAPS